MYTNVNPKLMSWNDTEKCLIQLNKMFCVLHEEKLPNSYLLQMLRDQCRNIGSRRTELCMNKKFD